MALGQPALECIISRMRLLYCARLVRVRPAALIALLHARPRGQKLLWIRQLERDSELLRPFLPCDFPQLECDPEAWSTIMVENDAWKALVARVHFTASVCDCERAPPEERARAYECHCGQAFASARALESHQRAKHGTRLLIQDYLPSPTCPACNVNFHVRVGLIAHVSDRRRPRCRDWIMANCTPLPAARATALRLEDRMYRREAQRAGHSHHLAGKPPVAA